MIAVGRNCEHNRDCGSHNHAAQISNEECAYHFVSLHFPCSLIKLSVVPIVYLGAINLKRLSLVEFKAPCLEYSDGCLLLH